MSLDGIADLANDLANDGGIVDQGLGRDLARQAHEPGGEQGLAGDAAVRVLLEDGIEDTVGNLVGHLVGMAHGHRFAREKVAIVIRHGRKSPSGRSSMCEGWVASGEGFGSDVGLSTRPTAPSLVLKSNKTLRRSEVWCRCVAAGHRRRGESFANLRDDTSNRLPASYVGQIIPALIPFRRRCRYLARILAQVERTCPTKAGRSAHRGRGCTSSRANDGSRIP